MSSFFALFPLRQGADFRDPQPDRQHLGSDAAACDLRAIQSGSVLYARRFRPL